MYFTHGCRAQPVVCANHFLEKMWCTKLCANGYMVDGDGWRYNHK